MTNSPRRRAKDPATRLLLLLRWLLALGAGAAVYLWVEPSPIPIVVAAWYVFESIHWIVSCSGPNGLAVALVYLLPRATCTALLLALTYLIGLPWPRIIASTFVTTVIVETIFRLLMRLVRPTTLNRAQTALYAVAGQPVDRVVRMGAGRTAATALCALLLILGASLTAYVFSARQVAFNTRFYAASLQGSGLYQALVHVASDTALDVARKQSPDMGRLVAHLSEEDVYLAGQLILPEPWTMSMVDRVLEATLSWLQANDDRRIPSISLPIDDLKRHIQDATSVLLDRHMAVLPVCTPARRENAFCRPAEMSVDAYVATYKPEYMATLDKGFALIPAALDLSTAVTMVPRPFEKLLARLTRTRETVRTIDRGLVAGGIACLSTLVSIWFLCAVTPRIWLTWMGVTLFVTGAGTWGASRALKTFMPAVAFRLSMAEWLADLPAALEDPLLHMWKAFFATTHAVVAPWALLLGGLGLVLTLLGLVMPRSAMWSRAPYGQRLTGAQAARTLVFTLALGSLLWTAYLSIGERLYNRASQAHRDGRVTEACALYQQIERRYPFLVSEFVWRARWGRRECQLYLDAESAYRAAEYRVAVERYEAFLLGDPAIALRDVAEVHLVESLLNWGASLQQAGDRERALDRYRFVRDERLDRRSDARVHQTIADLYLAWGNELQATGDYLAATATYRRILYDTADPRLWALAEDRMVDAYCAWSVSLREAGQGERASEVCGALTAEFPSLASKRCPACSP